MLILPFDPNVIKALSKTIADMFSYRELSEQFKIANIQESTEGTNKVDHIYYTFKNQQVRDNCANNIFNLFLR